MSGEVAPKSKLTFRQKASAMATFYKQWLKHTVAHWGFVSTIAAILGVLIPGIARLFPRVGDRMGPLVWQIPVAIFAVLGLLRFFLAPYWIYREKEEQALAFALEIETKEREINSLKQKLDVSSTETSARQKPRIEITVDRRTVFHTLGGVWHEGVGSGNPFVDMRQLALVGWVSNPTAPVGERAVKVYGISVTIIWKDENGNKVGFIQKAYWLDHFANNISLGAGEQQGFLLATVETDAYGLWSNPRSVVPQFGRSARRVINFFESQTRPVPNIVPSTAVANLDIAVVCDQTGETLAQKVVQIKRSENRLLVEN